MMRGTGTMGLTALAVVQGVAVLVIWIFSR